MLVDYKNPKKGYPHCSSTLYSLQNALFFPKTAYKNARNVCSTDYTEYTFMVNKPKIQSVVLMAPVVSHST